MQTLPVLSDDLEPVVRRVRQLVELSFARALQRTAGPAPRRSRRQRT